MIEDTFYISLLLIVYIYAGYPFCVFIIGFFSHKEVSKKYFTPKVSILIAAYNEEKSIETTISNKLQLNYPKDKLEIIVISDGSTDKTDVIVRKFQANGVRLLTQGPRAGKTAALNLAVPEAKGEILIFSDANSIYHKDALRELVANFNDPSVGYVTGHMVYTNPDGTLIGDGCSAYMKYENFLRKHETQTGSVVGVDGGVDAVRKELYHPMNPDQLPDFVLPLSVAEQGYRVIYEPKAILKEDTLNNKGDEYKMRVRVSLRALWALFEMRQLLLPRHSLIYTWQILSHKILRYICFIFLISAYISNLLLWPKNHYFKICFVFQNLAYLAAAISPFLEKRKINLKIFYFANYFTLLNIASAHAFFKFVLGKKQVLWTPRKG